MNVFIKKFSLNFSGRYRRKPIGNLYLARQLDFIFCFKQNKSPYDLYNFTLFLMNNRCGLMVYGIVADT